MFNRLTLELTNYCNLSCPMCLRHNIDMPLGYMDEELFYNLCDQAPTGTTIFPFWRGESLMHPQVDYLLYYAATIPGLEVVIATNGHLLPYDRIPIGLLKHINVISVSIHDALSLEGYNYLITQRNTLTVPVTRIEASVVEGETIIHDLPLRRYTRHSQDGKWGSVPNAPYVGREWCSRLDTDLCITWDGCVSRCCYVWEPIVGLDATKQSLQDIWNSKELREIRRNYPDNICQHCDQWSGRGKTL